MQQYYFISSNKEIKVIKYQLLIHSLLVFPSGFRTIDPFCLILDLSAPIFDGAPLVFLSRQVPCSFESQLGLICFWNVLIRESFWNCRWLVRLTVFRYLNFLCFIEEPIWLEGRTVFEYSGIWVISSIGFHIFSHRRGLLVLISLFFSFWVNFYSFQIAKSKSLGQYWNSHFTELVILFPIAVVQSPIFSRITLAKVSLFFDGVDR